jgi:hypothetical protein
MAVVACSHRLLLVLLLCLSCRSFCPRVAFHSHAKEKQSKYQESTAGCLQSQYTLVVPNPLTKTLPWQPSILNSRITSAHKKGCTYCYPPKKAPPVYKGVCGDVLVYLSYSKDAQSWVVSSRVCVNVTAQYSMAHIPYHT